MNGLRSFSTLAGGQIRADFGHHGQRGGHVHAVDAREVNAAHLKQLRAQIELRRIARAATLLILGGIALVNLQALQLQLDLGVALGERYMHAISASVEGLSGAFSTRR